LQQQQKEARERAYKAKTLLFFLGPNIKSFEEKKILSFYRTNSYCFVVLGLHLSFLSFQNVWPTQLHCLRASMGYVH
jgi:hypothetical protein